MPTEGTYKYEYISIGKVKALTASGVFTSAIKHKATANIISSLIGHTVKRDNAEWRPNIGDIAIAFKLNKRPKDGTVLDEAQLKAIGFTFGLITKIA